MDLFYTDDFHPGDRTLLISPEESRHAVKVLRNHKGDHLDLTDGAGNYLQGVIIEESVKNVTVEIEKVEKRPFPAENLIEVALPLIRPNRLDWAVEKLTELGIRKIIPITCAYSTTRKIKKDHLRKIMISAMKQSGQFYLPEIAEAAEFSRWIKRTANQKGLKFIAHQDSHDKNITRKTADELTYLAVGPEGGFHPEEITLALSSGFRILYLGESILRSETAAVVGVAKLKMILSS
ncbi:MAG: RsmE family RNA methyltransferase [Calditrichota bacterium]|jgi:16S rRNA (uracil1498-N3)-methyltransferase